MPSRRDRQQHIASLLDTARQQHLAGDLAPAEAAFRDILSADPNNPEALHRLGLILSDRGDLAAAAHYMIRSLGIAPNVPEFHNNLGEVFRKLGRRTEAKDCYDRAIKLRPAYAEALNNLALVLIDLSASDAAVRAATQAAKLAPNLPEVHITLGAALRSRQLYSESVAAYSQAVRLRPGSELAVTGLAAARAAAGTKLADILADASPQFSRFALLIAISAGYLGSQRFEDAEAALNQANQIEPDRFEVLINLANIHTSRRNHAEALALLRRAVALLPDHGALLNLGICLLTLGHFAEGWQGYEYRHRPNRPTDSGATRPQWRGEPCAGKTILIAQEQGFGDTFQFIRYASLIAARGARVLVQAPPAAAQLLASVPGVSQVLSDEPPRRFDFYCPVASLPFALATTLETVPATVPYITAPPAAVAAWKNRLPNTAFRVGIVWQGNPAHHNDRLRSLPLAALAPLASVPRVQLYSLQVGAGREQLALPDAPPVIDLAPHLANFSETAAALMNLDLVVAVDTAVIHLAGALARPVWSLHAYSPDFRWLLQRSDSPWYPTMKLYRQPAPNDWPSVVASLTADLTPLAQNHIHA
jgi:tetratricopeptide (TPR) repeat protein